MAMAASLSGAEICRPGLSATDGGRVAAADAGFVLACLRRPGAGLVDLWSQADQASCRSGRFGAAATSALPRAAARPVRGPALRADHSAAGLVDCERRRVARSMGLERHPDRRGKFDQRAWLDRFLAR